MAESVMYHEGNRLLQDQFDSRRISDRLEQKLMRKEFTADDKQYIESLPYFFLATADAKGRPDCSFKGGAPGFVRITGPSEIAFPDYDGNGMFKSLGNIVANPDVGLLFIAMHGKPRRLRVNGSARVSDNDPLLAETVGAQLIVRVTARAIFPTVHATFRRWGRSSRRSTRRSPDRTRRSRRGRVLRTSRTASIHGNRPSRGRCRSPVTSLDIVVTSPSSRLRAA